MLWCPLPCAVVGKVVAVVGKVVAVVGVLAVVTGSKCAICSGTEAPLQGPLPSETQQ